MLSDPSLRTVRIGSFYLVWCAFVVLEGVECRQRPTDGGRANAPQTVKVDVIVCISFLKHQKHAWLSQPNGRDCGAFGEIAARASGSGL